MPYKRYDVYSHLAREDLINWFEPFKNNSGPYAMFWCKANLRICSVLQIKIRSMQANLSFSD